MATVRVVELGFEEEIARIDLLAGSQVKVGFQADGTRVDGIDIVDIAIYNEFGTRRIPARPAMTNAAIKYQNDVAIIMEHLFKKVAEGAPVFEAMSTLGQAYQQRVQAHYRSGEFVENAPYTIKKKGSSVPLVDKGRHLVPNVRYVVENKT